MQISGQRTIFVGGDLRVPPKGRTHRCAPTFYVPFERNSVLKVHRGASTLGLAPAPGLQLDEKMVPLKHFGFNLPRERHYGQILFSL
jgi:hypothetical protein